MVFTKCINNSNIDNHLIGDFCKMIEERLHSIDFSKFNINAFTIHVVINADDESLRIASPLPREKRYIFYQGIPTEYAYNSSFEAKLATIRLRIQNIDVIFENEISNLIFIIDFRGVQKEKTVDNVQRVDNSNTANSDFSNETRKLFRRENQTEEDKRKATFIPVTPKYKLEKVIMTNDMAVQIDDALAIIKNRKKIYEEWGFGDVDPQPKAILSFWGPPGTGKTMCAHGIANAMNQKILAVNYAEIESKYAGESPKNLISAFNSAQENNAVLFFDEADSFLGKRISNVQSGHDQSINSLRSQMLIQLEEFEGIVIFATNLVKNFDPAFETRILRHIKFDLPDEAARITIYRSLIPAKAPFMPILTEEDLKNLSLESDGFSGRDIRNSILDAFSSAAKEGKDTLNFDYLLKAIRQRQESYKKLKDDKKKDNEKIVEDIKNSIIENSKKQFNEALIGVAIYAAWADNTMEQTEEQLLTELCSALHVEMPAGLSLEYMPPLSQILDYLNTNEKKLKAIDMAIRVIVADGNLANDEKEFIINLCKRLNINEHNTLELIRYSESLISSNMMWKNICSNFVI